MLTVYSHFLSIVHFSVFSFLTQNFAMNVLFIFVSSGVRSQDIYTVRKVVNVIIEGMPCTVGFSLSEQQKNMECSG